MNKRYCYWINETQTPVEGGFIPSVVIENEAGHTPLAGDPKTCQAPWVWGPTLTDAQRTADQANTELGLTRKQAMDIVTSSMWPTT